MFKDRECGCSLWVHGCRWEKAGLEELNGMQLTSLPTTTEIQSDTYNSPRINNQEVVVRALFWIEALLIYRMAKLHSQP